MNPKWQVLNKARHDRHRRPNRSGPWPLGLGEKPQLNTAFTVGLTLITSGDTLPNIIPFSLIHSTMLCSPTYRKLWHLPWDLPDLGWSGCEWESANLQGRFRISLVSQVTSGSSSHWPEEGVRLLFWVGASWAGWMRGSVCMSICISVSLSLSHRAMKSEFH